MTALWHVHALRERAESSSCIGDNQRRRDGNEHGSGSWWHWIDGGRSIDLDGCGAESHRRGRMTALWHVHALRGRAESSSCAADNQRRRDGNEHGSGSWWHWIDVGRSIDLDGCGADSHRRGRMTALWHAHALRGRAESSSCIGDNQRRRDGNEHGSGSWWHWIDGGRSIDLDGCAAESHRRGGMTAPWHAHALRGRAESSSCIGDNQRRRDGNEHGSGSWWHWIDGGWSIDLDGCGAESYRRGRMTALWHAHALRGRAESSSCIGDNQRRRDGNEHGSRSWWHWIDGGRSIDLDGCGADSHRRGGMTAL